MAARIQQLQRKQRLADAGVSLPPDVLAQQLAALPGARLARFRDALASFATLGCTYKEQEGLKEARRVPRAAAAMRAACRARPAAPLR